MYKQYIYLDEKIEYHLVRQKRKTIGIYVDIFGNIEIRVPREATEEEIRQHIEEKWDWIRLTAADMKARMSGMQKKDYASGEVCQYLGSGYITEIIQDTGLKQDKVEIAGTRLLVYVRQLEDDSIKQALKRFYYQKCKLLVEGRIRYYQTQFKIKPSAVRIYDSKIAWGICDANRRLSFNWKLVMAPMEVIDYIVVHEMCHMVHLNHDRSFWRLLGRLLPDYEQRQNWLLQSGWKMEV